LRLAAIICPGGCFTFLILRFSTFKQPFQTFIRRTLHLKYSLINIFLKDSLQIKTGLTTDLQRHPLLTQRARRKDARKDRMARVIEFGVFDPPPEICEFCPVRPDLPCPNSLRLCALALCVLSSQRTKATYVGKDHFMRASWISPPAKRSVAGNRIIEAMGTSARQERDRGAPSARTAPTRNKGMEYPNSLHVVSLPCATYAASTTLQIEMSSIATFAIRDIEPSVNRLWNLRTPGKEDFKDCLP
jgi:hypothetical protein